MSLCSCVILGKSLCTPLSSYAFWNNEEIFSDTKFCMGTFVTLTARHSDKKLVAKSFAKAFDKIYALEKYFTRHTSSLLTTLNEDKVLINPPQEFKELLLITQEIEKQTNYAFNPSILPLLEYLENTKKVDKEIDEEELKKYANYVQENSFIVEENRVLLKEKNTKITLDAIAKGFITDKAFEVLEKEGFENFLINSGGDMRVKGMKTNSFFHSEYWTVAIEDPEKEKNYPAVLSLKDQAIATSGSYEKNFSEDIHHIIMPRKYTAPISTNTVSAPIKSVSVIAPNATLADALATALACMPTQEALNFVNERKELACLIITNDGKKHVSHNFNSYLKV